MKKIALLLILLSIILIVHAQNTYEVHQSISKIDSIPISKEKQFVEQNFPYIPMNKWKEGMRFIVPFNEKYDKNNDIHGLNNYTKSNRLNLNYILKDELKWKILTLIGLEYRRKDKQLYLIFDCEGKKYMLCTYKSEEDFKNGEDGFIDGLVYVDEIDKAKEQLLGKKLYIMDKSWYDENRTKPGYKEAEKSKKYYPVTIINIGVANLTTTTPIRIIFKTELGNEFYRDVKFSRTNNLYSGTVETYQMDAAQRNNFENVFSFDDPYLKYPNISKEIWENIQEGIVSIGMTEEECILSWGKPKEINRSSYGSDQWVYSEQYLYFENGKLTAFN